MLRSALIIAAVSFALSGWWYLRNWILYNDPIFSKAIITIMPHIIRLAPFTITTAIEDLKTLYVSFFGFFGALEVPVSGGHLLIYGTIAGMGTIGMCRIFCAKNSTAFQRRALRASARDGVCCSRFAFCSEPTSLCVYGEIFFCCAGSDSDTRQWRHAGVISEEIAQHCFWASYCGHDSVKP